MGGDGNHLTSQQINALLTQAQQPSQQPVFPFSPFLSQNRNQGPSGVAQIYQNWVNGLLQPYQPPMPAQQQPGLLGQLRTLSQQPDWYDSSITPSGGGH